MNPNPRSFSVVQSRCSALLSRARVFAAIPALFLLFLLLACSSRPDADPESASSGPDSGPVADADVRIAPKGVSGVGGRCGGNNTNHPVCAAGLACVPIPGNRAPFGDVGGVCATPCDATGGCSGGATCDPSGACFSEIADAGAVDAAAE